MQVTTERITPTKAQQYLNDNRTNRSLRDGVAEKYAADMVAGRWTKCVAPIVFYEDGNLADGQHRLFAIVESGTPQTFLVVRGLDRASGLNIDTGLGRSLVDNARISGADRGLSNELIAVARAVHSGTKVMTAMSNAERLAIVQAHRAACEWAISNGSRGRMLRNAVVLGAIARAWYHEGDKDRLKRFGYVVSTGFAQGDRDAAAVALRNYILRGGSSLTTSANWRDTFLKTQNAIKYFMRGRKLTVIKAVNVEAYPLPAPEKR